MSAGTVTDVTALDAPVPCPRGFAWCVDHMGDDHDPGAEGVHQTRAFSDVTAMHTPRPHKPEHRWHVAYLDTEFMGETAEEVAGDLRAYALDLVRLAEHLDEIGAGR